MWHKALDEIYRLYNYIAEVVHDGHVWAKIGQASPSMRRDSSGTVDQPEHAHFHVKCAPGPKWQRVAKKKKRRGRGGGMLAAR